jgi:hypothetical protein
MHQALKGSGQRDMVAVDAATGTVHINAAVVPRVRGALLAPPPGAAALDAWGEGASPDPADAPPGAPRGPRVRARHFVTVELRGGAAVCASNVWLARADAAPGAPEAGAAQAQGSSPEAPEGGGARGWRVVRKEALLRSAASGDPGRLVRRAWQASAREWQPVVSPAPPAQAA